MAKAGKLGAIYKDTGAAAISMTDEATTADATFTRYTITNDVKRYWDKSQALTVEVDASPVTSGFTLEYPGGVVVFDSSQEGSTVTVSGYYLTVSEVGGFYNWAIDEAMNVSDSTTFGDSYKEFTATQLEFTGSAEAFWADDTYYSELGTEVILVFYVDEANDIRYEGYGTVTTDSVEVPADELVVESLELQGSGVLYYRES